MLLYYYSLINLNYYYYPLKGSEVKINLEEALKTIDQDIETELIYI
jgi:hypothetical protein